MQIILWGLAIYCAVQFLLFSGYVLEGLRYYIKNKPFSNLVLTLMYISAIVIMYSLVFDYVKIENAEESGKFWMLFILKIGSIVVSFGWFWLVGKAVLLEADKFTERILKR
jgi:hypothetical protein